MVRYIFVLAIFVSSVSGAAELEPDYGTQRLALAASKDYNAYALQVKSNFLLTQYHDLVADPQVPVMDLNKPLAELVRTYPLGVQVNLELANFLEYAARRTDPAHPDQAKGLLDIAAARRKMAEGILASIEKSGDGSSPDHAMVVINIMEELAVLDSRGLRKQEQVLIERNGKFVDAITAETVNGARSTIYFDVSLFYRPSELSK
jgi:hypothetical protein